MALAWPPTRPQEGVPCRRGQPGEGMREEQRPWDLREGQEIPGMDTGGGGRGGVHGVMILEIAIVWRAIN